MNKFLTIPLVLLLGLFLSTNLLAANAGDYQSKQSGPWSDAASWQTYDGTTWNDAGAAPTGSSGTITIQSGHTITVATALTINSGIQVIVNGYLKATAAITASTTVLSFTFNSGSTYEHAMDAGSIPMSNWNIGSTCLVTGTTGTSPGNNFQPYYNFTWNCTGMTKSLNLSWDSTSAVPVVVRGNLTVTASGTPTPTSYQFRMTNAATVRNIRINGNINVNGGYLTVAGSSGAAQYNITVGGNITLSSGALNLCGGSGGFGTWYLNGDFSCTGTGQLVLPSNKSIGTILIFSKSSGTQNFTYTSVAGGGNLNLNYGVMNNAAVQLNSPILVGSTSNPGYLVLTSGKFITTATNIITVSATSVVSGSGYIDGPLATTVAVSTSKVLNLPLGKGSNSRPVTLTLTQDAATSTIYTAELLETTPNYTLPFALDAIATARYFHIVKGTGANVSSATIQLSYDSNDGVDVSNKNDIRIAKDDGSGAWLNLGGSGTANNTGTILSNSFGTVAGLGTLITNDFAVAHVNPASEASPPTLSTNAITFISTTFATSGGVISNDGNGAITAKGVCWNLTGSATISDGHTSDGTTSTPFTSSITGLVAGNTYYIRAYATNSAGTSYGNEVTFTTLASLSTPTIATNAVVNIVNTSASGGGNITAWGGSPITDRGICWSTSHNPTLETAIDFNSAGAGNEGSFTAPLGGLTLGTTYYACAYATNGSGTSYGNEVSFNTPTPQLDVYKIVDINGTVGVNKCDYLSVYDAFQDVPTNYTGHWFIYVRKGVYYDKITLAAGKINVVLIGEDRDNTILTYDDYAGNNRTTHGVLSNGTNTSYSVAIDAADFQAQNITFRNTANAYYPGSGAAQGVALRVNGDRQSYYNCKMLGFQDTYYTQGGITGPDRLYHKNCYIEGSVDFIFGRDVALFDNCTIYCNRQGGVLTAGATEFGYSYGYVFLNSTLGSPAAGVIGADLNPMTTFYLGRPWQTAPKTVYINCYEPATVNAAGWTTMGPNPSLYSEYNCYGPGAAFRPVMPIWVGANQPSVLTDEQAATYTIANIFSKNNKGSGFSYAANWTPLFIVPDEKLLPVELTSFTAITENRNIILKWSTATEKNSSAFEVEKKQTTSNAWQKIASVKAANLSNSPKYYSFADKNVSTGKYDYRLKMVDNDGTFKYSAVITAEIAAPAKFDLLQNYPNPWNPTTRISYSLAFNSNVKLIIYNSLGESVKELVNGIQNAGFYETILDANSLPSGVYLYKIQAVSSDGQQNFTSTKKMILIK